MVNEKGKALKACSSLVNSCSEGTMVSAEGLCCRELQVSCVMQMQVDLMWGWF